MTIKSSTVHQPFLLKELGQAGHSYGTLFYLEGGMPTALQAVLFFRSFSCMIERNTTRRPRPIGHKIYAISSLFPS